MPDGKMIVGPDSLPADIITTGGKNRLAVDTEVNVSVEDFFSFDNNADSYFTITTAGGVGDVVTVQVDTPSLIDVDITLTATEAGDADALASLIVTTLAADNTFDTYFQAKALHDKVYVIAKDKAERGEYPEVSPDDFRVTATGTTVIDIEADFNRIIRRKKLILGEPDQEDNRYVRLGIFGEVGSRTKAENPINIVVRKNIASTTQSVFGDNSVPASQIWYIGAVAVADDVKGELNIWEGVNRDEVDEFTADGTLFTHILDYGCLKDANYHTVLINDAGTFVEGTDYVIEDDPANAEQSQLRWTKSATKPANLDTVKITYDAVIRRLGLFVPSSSSATFTFNAPIKLTENKFVISTIEQSSGTSAVAIVTISGFFEVVII